jgi:hypothetical protein
MSPIEIRIDPARFNHQPVLIGVRALEELRAAGVPVVGDLWPMGVTEGELVCHIDPMFGEITIAWRREG